MSCSRSPLPTRLLLVSSLTNAFYDPLSLNLSLLTKCGPICFKLAHISYHNCSQRLCHPPIYYEIISELFRKHFLLVWPERTERSVTSSSCSLTSIFRQITILKTLRSSSVNCTRNLLCILCITLPPYS
jgi:hypothetical protein